jgi:hypothetical protein
VALLGVDAAVHAEGCRLSSGADLLGADVGGISPGVKRWGSVAGVTAYSFSTTVCNVGDAGEPFEAFTSDHPVIAMNLYRLHQGRFEQIGMSWVKHTFGSATGSFCCQCQDPGSGQLLGVGCSDPYSSDTNGNQAGFGGMSGLGPRSDIDPVTGLFPFPYTTQGASGDAIYKRLQVRNADLDPALNPGAQYFGEIHYIGRQDAIAGNRNNNMAYRPAVVGSFVDGGWNVALSGITRQGTPAIMAWSASDPQVLDAIADVPLDGRFILSSRSTDNGDGTWRYEFALYNMNSGRAAGRFSVPIGAGVTVSDVGFHDVDSHSGEVYDSTDWSVQVGAGAVTWSTDDFATDPDANALRWGALYSFRFDADRPPATVGATIGLFAPGSPSSVGASAFAPAPAGAPGDLDGSGAVDITDLLTLLAAWGPCPAPCPPCGADLDGDCQVGVTDLLVQLANWG